MKRYIDQFDIDAEKQGQAITRHREITIKPNGRDDNKIRTKNNSIYNGIKPTRKLITNKRCKQVTYQHENICKQLCAKINNKELLHFRNKPLILIGG